MLKQREIMALLGRYSKLEAEFNVPWIPFTTLRSPTSIRTDRILSFLQFHFHGRIGITVNPYAALTVDPLRNLLQEIRVLGSHAQFGSTTPFRIPALFQTGLNQIYSGVYAPRDVLFLGGAPVIPPVFTGVAGNWDVDVFWILPLFPLPISLQLAALYSLKGPDWAGNLFVETDAGDATALGTLGAGTLVAFTAYGAAAGNPTLNVDVVRPLVTTDFMNQVSPAIPFRSYLQVDNVVGAAGVALALGTVANLNIGKRMASVHTQSGTLQLGVTPGVRAYAALLDGIINRVVMSLDGKNLAVPSSGLGAQNMASFLRGNVLPAGYNSYNFMDESGNPDAAFAAETLTAARRFQLVGDVVPGANQGMLISQDEILGSPQILG